MTHPMKRYYEMQKTREYTRKEVFMIKKLVLWLILKYLPGYHLSKNPKKHKKSGNRDAQQADPLQS